MLALGLLAGLLALAPIEAVPAPRIVAVADVHGAAEAFASLLRRAALIDAQQRWIGGNAILVQTGDVTDRGPGVRAVLDLLMALEPQASAAGGRVQVLLGNHEVLNLLGETRDVSAEILESFADAQSGARIAQALETAGRIKRIPDKAAWVAAHPPGLLEYRDAFAPSGRYGKWLRSKPVLVEIGGTVFMHAGISPVLRAGSLDDVIRRVRRDLADWDAGVRWMEDRKLVAKSSSFQHTLTVASGEMSRLSADLAAEGQPSTNDMRGLRMLQSVADVGNSSLLAADGPLWFRGYATWTDDEGEAQMAALLKKYNVMRFVTGHTPQPAGRITTRFGGSLFLIDTGMLDSHYFPGGRPAALEITGDRAVPIYPE